MRIVKAPDIPEIQVGPDISRMTDEAVKAIAGDPYIYQRAGELVHVVTTRDRPEAGPNMVRRPQGAPVIKALKLAGLRERLSASARWLKYDGHTKTTKPTTPAETAVQAVSARGQWDGVRPLVGVITAPTMRPDGSVLQEPGYDKATGLLYIPNALYPVIDDEPKKDDAIGARNSIMEIAQDFPFAKDQHRSAWLAGLLTCIARPAIDGPCPLFAVDATTRGTGKTRLVHAISRCVFGQEASAFSQPEDEDELRKRITSILYQGDSLVLIDNVAKALGGASLDAVLTSDTWADRQLGANTTIKVPNRAVWWATANNLTLQGDIARRTMQIRLESMHENPEERTDFLHADLLSWIGRERHRLVGSALTLLRAYIAAGSPCSTGTTWGSFESWSQFIPGVIRWIDMEDPLLARATADEMLDQDRQTLVHVLQALNKMDPQNNGLTARAIIQLLFPARERNEPPPQDGYDDMREAVEAITRCISGRVPDAIRFGKYLQKNRGRVLLGYRIERVALDASNTIRWTVRRVAKA